MTYKNLTNSHIKDIIQLYIYNNRTLQDIATLYGFKSYGPIKTILQKNDIILRKKGMLRAQRLHALNLNYFENIDSAEKAYWLGFLFADGCINPYKTTLLLKDIEPIIEFKKSIDSSHKICSDSFFDKRTNKTYSRHSIQISSKHFTSHLIKFGLGHTQYKNYDFPNISEQYHNHFLRGLFDGDGTICFIGQKITQIKLSIIISNNIINFIQTHILPQFNMPVQRDISKVTDNPNYKIGKLNIGSKAILFLEYLYKNSTPSTRLNRKYQKFLDYKYYIINEIHQPKRTDGAEQYIIDYNNGIYPTL